MKKITITFCSFLAALECLLPRSTHAEVHIVRCDPPISVDSFADPPPGLDWATTAFDFDLDGQPEFRLTYGMGVMTAYFNFPTSFAVKAQVTTLPGIPDLVVSRLPAGPVAAVPLGSVIGSNIVSSVNTNFYVWSLGSTNGNYFPELLGNYQAEVMVADLAIPTQPVAPQPIISISTNGFVTNLYFPSVPFVIGDVAGKEGVMALQFYIGSELHYGYIHFNFKGGAGGLIYGWAYETEPNVPITAMPLLPGEKLNKRKILFDINPVQRRER